MNENLNQQLLQRLLPLAREAGKLAMSMIEDSSPSLKPDSSVLTQADLAVSHLVKTTLGDLFASGEHILIDEEDPENSRYFKQSVLEKVPYVWAVDPIDGTRAFANRMPLFGFSLGVLKNLRPWLGVVYFPMFNELFYCDGQKSFFVKNAFTSDEKKVEILPVDQQITRQAVFFGSDAFFKEYDWDFSFCQVMLPSSAVVDFCWPAIGRGVGCIFDSNLWDFVGSWPICQAAGLEIRSLLTGQALEKISLDVFQGQGSRTWRLKDFYLLSSSRNFELIKNHMRPRQI